jgi:putative ABC transport system permease protein
MGTVWQDLKYAIRALRKNLVFTLVRGRTFNQSEVRSRQPAVAVVNETFVRQNWPNGNAIGKVILFGGERGGTVRFSVIGIVGDEHQFGPDEASHPEMYLPGHHLQDMILLVRTAGDPLSFAFSVEQQLWNVDKEQPVSDVKSMEGVLREWLAPRRFSMTVLMNFAGVALLLSALGLYSVLAYSVTLRAREIGIRVALGADPRNVALFVLRQALRLTFIGVGIGIAGALVLTRFMQSLIFGISATDPATFAFVTLILIVVAVVASYVPARRAAQIDPVEALRVE